MSWMAVAVVGSAVVGGIAAKSAASDAADAQSEATDKSIAAQKEAQKLDPRVEKLIYGDAFAPERRLKSGVSAIYSNPVSTEKTRQVYTPRYYDENGFSQGGFVVDEKYTDTTDRKIINPDSDYETPTQNTGIVGKIGGLLEAPKSSGTNVFNAAVNEYMRGNAIMDLGNVRKTARDLQSGEVPVNRMGAAQVNAPSQNSLQLKDAYDRMIYGNLAENPYLTGALQGGIDQSKRAFDRMQEDAIRGITENVLPSIRSGAQVNGQYGGNRQALAESGAIGELSRSMARTAENYGNQNTSAVLGAQAGAYESGQNRALSAMSGLGGQQYSTAGQNAQLAQQANLANLESQNKAQSQSFANKATGAGMQSGLLGSVYGMQQNADNAEMNKLGGVSSLLAPYTKTPNVNVPQYQPVYSNVAGGAMGGATAGMGLYNAFNQGNQGGVLPSAASAPSSIQGMTNNTYLSPTGGNNYGLLGSGFYSGGY